MTIDSSAGPRRRTPRGQGRATLVTAARQLFAEQGVSGTSLQSIADRLGVTKAAVHHQLASKQEIVIAVAEPVIERLRSIADAAELLSPEPARAAVIRGLVDLALDHGGTSAVLRRDPTMSQILDSHGPYREQLERIDELLVGPSPSRQRRVALAFAGGAIMTLGALPGLDGPGQEVRDGLIAAISYDGVPSHPVSRRWPSRCRTARPDPTAALAQRSTARSPRGWEQHTKRSPTAGGSRGSGL